MPTPHATPAKKVEEVANKMEGLELEEEEEEYEGFEEGMRGLGGLIERDRLRIGEIPKLRE